jgi:uncharacterized membrane protein YfcA
MDPVLIAAAFLILLLSGFVQGLVGFGSALIAVPTLSIFMGPKTVVPLTLVHGLLMNMYLSVRNRRFMQRKRVFPLFAAGILGIPAGAAVLIILPSSGLKVLIGLVISVFTLLLLMGYSYRFKREAKVLFPVGFLSGFLNGSVSMSGPPIILFLSNQKVSRVHFRANTVTYFFLLNIVTFVVFLITGVLKAEILLLSIILLPPLPVGILLGEHLSGKISENWFSRIALLLVMAAGLSALISGMIAIV